MSVALQIACDGDYVPGLAQFERWSVCALDVVRSERTELNIRVVNAAEMTQFNHCFRGQNQATNVLAFPFAPIAGVEMALLGDIAICAAVVAQQARAQNKSLDAHWAHLVIHGILHLCGYEHISTTEASAMESLETNILSELGYSNPY